MVWLASLITLLSIVVWVYAFFDAATTPGDEVRSVPKILWLVLIVLFMPVAVLWFFLGRPRRTETAASAQLPQNTSAEHLDPSDVHKTSGRQQPRGPDDDPEFLRKLNKRINPDD